MTIILLIRHGENDWVGNRLAGRLPDIHLNKTGLCQAENLATTLKDLPIKAIYSSPLERAMETAQPLSSIKNLEISICDELSEINFGDWQGKTIKQLRRLKLWKTVQEKPSQMQFPNGESLADAQLRLVQCINMISNNHESTDLVACFSHSDSIRLLVNYYFSMPLDCLQRIHINTASVTVLMLVKDHISIPYVNLVDPDKFITQFKELNDHSKREK